MTRKSLIIIFFAMISAGCGLAVVDDPIVPSQPEAPAPSTDPNVLGPQKYEPTSCVSSVPCNNVCPDGQTPVRDCAKAIPIKIFRAPRMMTTNYFDETCICPEPKPDAGVPTKPDAMLALPLDAQLARDTLTPEATISDTYVPVDVPVDAPRIIVADAGIPVDTYVPPVIIPVDAQVKMDTNVPPSIITPDARVQTDTFVPPPQIIIPDASIKLDTVIQPDAIVLVDTILSTDTQIEPDTQITPDTTPTTPDTMPETKIDTQIVCNSNMTSWANSIALTQSSECQLTLTWEVDGCSTMGYKIVYSQNESPTYPPRSGDTWAYISDYNIKTFTVNVDPGTYYVRVCQYLGGRCGTYSNELAIDIN